MENINVPIPSSIDTKYIRTYILSGHSVFSIENIDSGNYFTYKVTRNKKVSNMYFVNLETGLGNIYAGYFYVQGQNIDYHKGEKGNFTEDDIRIKALLYVLENFERLPKKVIVYHQGYCAVCGHILNINDEQCRGLCDSCYLSLALK